MQNREIILRNPHGLHLRLARDVVRLGKSHQSKVTLSCGDCRYADGCSILALLMLEAGPGTPVQVQIEGPDEVQVALKLTELLTDGAGI